MKSDLIDISVSLIYETEKAWLVSDTGQSDNAVWIPKSRAELGPSDTGGIMTLTLPERLAQEKGLI